MLDLASPDFWLGLVLGVLLTLAAFGADQAISLVVRCVRTVRRRRRSHDRAE